MAHEYTQVDNVVAQKLVSKQNKAIYSEAFVQFGENKVFLPKFYSYSAQQILDMKVRQDDLWICSFIKAGTTWTKEMAWLLLHDMDFEAAMALSYIRVPYLEFDATWPVQSISKKLKEDEDKPSTMEIVASLKSPRTIQTHLPLELLPHQLKEQKPKIIYVARNPKDVCVSFYHHRVLIEGYLGTVDDFAEEFVNDLSLYAPFWSHVRTFWEMRNEPNVLFLTYEKLKKDLSSVVDKTAKFLDKTITHAEKEQLLDHLSFEKMKNNPHINLDEITNMLIKIHGVPRQTHFFRKGKVGSWREELAPHSIAMMDEWIQKNKIPGLWDDLD